MRLSVRNVGKLYQGRVRALDAFSLEVEPGPARAGAHFIPALALACGAWSNSNRLFEALYVAMWYLGPLNRVPALDFMGASGNATHPGLWLTLAAAGILLAVLARMRRLAFTG